MKLTILSVAFPFARVSPDPVGGAEQVLAQLDRALVSAGHRAIVIAAAGARVAGRLVSVPWIEPSSDSARNVVHHAVRRAVEQVLAHEHIDAIHLHAADFELYLPPGGPPALVTLHLPLDWYAPGALRPQRPLTWLQPVSASQARTAPRDLCLLPPIANGIDCDAIVPQRT